MWKQQTDCRVYDNAEERNVIAEATVTRATAPHCPQCPRHGLRSLPSSPSARLLLHYLKHSLVFICRARDVTRSSTVPSRAVYIREPIWRYKTRQRKGGGSDPESGETWKPFYGATHCALRTFEHREAECEGDFCGVVSYEWSGLTNNVALSTGSGR